MRERFLASVAARTLWDQRRGLLGWSLALLLLTLMTASYFPTLQAQADEFQELLDSYPPAMKAFFGGLDELTTPRGYLWAQMFSATLPLLVLVYAIGRGSDLVAGAEERGELDMLLALPLTRRQVVLQKAAGLAAGVGILSIALWVALLVGSVAFDLGLGPLTLAGAVVAWALLGLAVGNLALLVGCVRGRRAAAVAVAATVGVASYVLDSLANLVEALEPVRGVSLWHQYALASPLSGDVNAWGVLVLLGLAGGFVALAVVAFDGRDVGV